MNYSSYRSGDAPATHYGDDPSRLHAQTALLDTVFPGFSLLSTAVYKYTRVDLSIYIPIFLALWVILFASKYTNDWMWQILETHLMSTADVRIDDEMYNMVMGWISNQKISSDSRRFVANTNLKSRDWHLWRSFEDEEEDDKETVEFDAEGNPIVGGKGKKKQTVRFTPSFGTHYFWYKKRLLIFKRQENQRKLVIGENQQEEISVSSFGRNPAILKELLDECRQSYMKNDEDRTVIYRGGLKPGSGEPTWTRCASRSSRPFSTVVLDESVKQSLLDDMRDYLHPYTRRWYSNRGIPYRRGYLLFGPPGTGKSSLSFAIAGYFNLQIYIVSLNNPAMSEENLGTLFTELPKQCVVLLEDIDTAGLTHTRDGPVAEPKPLPTVTPGAASPGPGAPPVATGKISLSALLNILDGVASQEGRVLIMTTNHMEKLDEALIRPGRVDMTVKFGLANAEMINLIFRGIYATLEGDVPMAGSLADTPLVKAVAKTAKPPALSKKEQALEEERRAGEAEAEAKRVEANKQLEEQRIVRLGMEFAALIPDMTFSPAEIQGYLLKHKREPEVAIKEAAAWVVKTIENRQKEKEKKAREEKERLEKEAKEAKEKAEEEKKKLDEEAEDDEDDEDDEEEEEKKKKLEKQKKLKKKKTSKKQKGEDGTVAPKVNGVKDVEATTA